jgi:hypothetical protein
MPHTSALSAANNLAGAPKGRAEQLSEQLGYAVAFTQHLALVVKADE